MSEIEFAGVVSVEDLESPSELPKAIPVYEEESINSQPYISESFDVERFLSNYKKYRICYIVLGVLSVLAIFTLAGCVIYYVI